MRKLVILALLALITIALWAWTRQRSEQVYLGTTRTITPEPALATSSPAPLVARPASSMPAPAKPAPTAVIFAPPDERAMIEVDKVNLMVRDYRTLAGENPVGTNAEIMAAVMGGNPKQAKLGPPEGMQLNANGELIDRWGTPYFFHQLSRNQMEIRSAGADRVMWTEDDAVIK